jgi:hypothetical protein
MSAARLNQSKTASFTQYDLDHPFAEGAFRYVAKGVYTSGPREGQKAVCKWFKSGVVFESSFYESDLKAVDKALDIIEKWNDAGFINKKITLNFPAVWVFSEGCSLAGQKVLQEPFIENWEKFNSNSGWVNDETNWGEVMQALSHYSYHSTGGQIVLCDLQGGIYSDGVVLSDPVILSRNRTYGVTDLGANGIESFFHRHECNQYCQRKWSRPKYTRQSVHVTKATTMIAVRTMAGRPPMTHKW